MVTHQPITVLFRVDKSNEVTAFFPTEVGTNDRVTCACYSHVGQHGTAHKTYYRLTRRATPEEYAALARELETIGYDLEIRSSWTKNHDRRRFRKLMDTGKPIHQTTYEYQRKQCRKWKNSDLVATARALNEEIEERKANGKL